LDGEPDGAPLVGHSPGNGLSDPPCGVCRELESLGVVELLHRANESEIALLDQVEQWHAASRVAFGQRNDQTQVRLHQVLFGGLPVSYDGAEIAAART